MSYVRWGQDGSELYVYEDGDDAEPVITVNHGYGWLVSFRTAEAAAVHVESVAGEYRVPEWLPEAIRRGDG
jgi:hypothetical protein